MDVAQWYRNALAQAAQGKINWSSGNAALTITLHTATYTPNLDTDVFVSPALTNELAAGSGYTTGGKTLGTIATAYTAANSWGVSRANSTAYLVDDIIRPATGNGFIYRCSVAGTSAGTTTTLGTIVGDDTVDGTAHFECAGSGIVQLTAANPSWASPFSAGPFRYAVISDRTTGVTTTEPLVGLIDFGSNQTGGGGALTVNFATNGVLVLFIP